jgi:DNA repair exonuclease SbcCD nuclease subunit
VDAGYGDLRMRRNGDIVVVSYHGNHETAAIKQYVARIGAALSQHDEALPGKTLLEKGSPPGLRSNAGIPACVRRERRRTAE